MANQKMLLDLSVVGRSLAAILNQLALAEFGDGELADAHRFDAISLTRMADRLEAAAGARGE
jgi:hypothetical protein